MKMIVKVTCFFCQAQLDHRSDNPSNRQEIEQVRRYMLEAMSRHKCQSLTKPICFFNEEVVP